MPKKRNIKAQGARIDEIIRASKAGAELLRDGGFASMEEFEIVYSEDLSLDEKRARIRAIRQAREMTARQVEGQNALDLMRSPDSLFSMCFEDRIQLGDAILAHGMGISLD